MGAHHDHDHDHDGHDHPHGHDHHGHDDHGHGHHHGPGGHVHTPFAMGGDPRKALLAALILNGGFLIVEAVAGWWTDSLALLSDAAHMVSDVGALALAYGAAHLARRPSAARMTFGLRRAETLGGFVNGILLLVAVAWIVVEAVVRLSGEPPHVDGAPVLVVALIGLAINLGSAFALWRGGHDDLNVRAALAHMLADALGSVGAAVAAVAVLYGMPAADAVVSIGVALLVGIGAWKLVHEAGGILLQLPPEGFDVDRLVADLVALEGVAEVHDLHVWTLQGRAPIVSAHLATHPEASPSGVAAAARRLAREAHGVEHTTFQVEAADESGCVSHDCGAGSHGH